MAGHSGVIDYEPSELVITARAGTPLRDIQPIIGGAWPNAGFRTAGLRRPRQSGRHVGLRIFRPWRLFAGAARDFMLGCKIVNGHGEILNFGGQVMKNVAGFDVSRLMVGALGTPRRAAGIVHSACCPAPKRN